MATKKPKRPLKTVLSQVRHLRRIELLEDDDAITKFGELIEPKSHDSVINSRDSLNILIWNLWKGSGGKVFIEEFLNLYHKFDIILAQEALLTTEMIDLFNVDGFESYHASSYIRSDGCKEGVITATRLQKVGDVKRIVGRSPEPILKTPKTSLVSIHKLPFRGQRSSDKSIMLINIHARLFRRLDEASDDIIHVLERLPNHDGPILFAGDFNTFSKKYLKIVKNTLKAYGLEHVEIPHDPRSPTGALDQVFVRGLEVKSISIDTSIRGSDHFPIVMQVKC